MLDTSVFIGAEQSDPFAVSASHFVATHSVRISSVVVAELIVGARSTRLRTRLIDNLRQQATLLGAVTATVADWDTVAMVWTKLAPVAAERPSIWNDPLLAASCSRTGATLIMANNADFKRIARYIPLRHTVPWPSGNEGP